MARFQCNAQLMIFLDMISFSEGTQIAGSDDGYNVVVGGSLFKGYENHPNILVDLPKLKTMSTAAGRYQILNRIARHYIRDLDLPDFGPVSQDKIALQLISECKATWNIKNGFIDRAIIQCASRWASFPGAGYGQREHKAAKLIEYFKSAGGWVNE